MNLVAWACALLVLVVSCELVQPCLAFRWSKGWVSTRSRSALASLTAQAHMVNEFSRIVNLRDVPVRQPCLCRVAAKEHEVKLLAKRFSCQLEQLHGNVTIVRDKRTNTLTVQGDYLALVREVYQLPPSVIKGNFSTTLLLPSGKTAAKCSLDDVEFDDEVPSSGNIDIGEVVAQYFCLDYCGIMS
jgi:hypothetical protein